MKPKLYTTITTKVLSLLLLMSALLMTGTTQAQVTIDGNPIEWGTAAVTGLPHFDYSLDYFGTGVVDDQFTEGSKDFMTAAELTWAWGQTKAKNDLCNGAAVIITNPTGNAPNGLPWPAGTYVFFAGDRSKVQGDAQIGFWLFLDGTAPIPIPYGENYSDHFAPEHNGTAAQPGDILVLADFTGGGNAAAVTVYQWVGPGNGTAGNNLSLINITTNATVAENNTTGFPIPSGWSYPNGGPYPINAFYEGFVDISALIQNTGLCQPSFLLECRSSQSLTASLDDFIGGSIPMVDLTCPGDTTIGPCLSQQAVNTAFTAWLAMAEVTGSTNTAITTNPANPEAPDACGGSITVTFTAVDTCANPASCEATFTVIGDTIAPSILDKPDYTLTGCNAPWPTSVTTSYTDNCSTGGIITAVPGIEVTTGCFQYVDYTFSFSDACGNTATSSTRITREYDMTVPVIADKPDFTLVGCNTNWPASVTTSWTDNCSPGGTLTGVEGTITTLTCQQYRDYTFNVVDNCGNTAVTQVTRVTRDYDVIPPVLQSILEDLTFNCPEEIIIPNPVYTDNCGTVTVTCLVNGEFSCTGFEFLYEACPGEYEVCFTAEDECGNSTTDCITVTLVPCCETAFGSLGNENAECFYDYGFNRWGWSNYIETEGVYTIDLYQGNPSCTPMVENHVGVATVTYLGGNVTVHYLMDPGFSLDEAHVNVDCDMFPTLPNGNPTVAPGQYTYVSGDLDYVNELTVTFTDVTGPIYVIVHAGACNIGCVGIETADPIALGIDCINDQPTGIEAISSENNQIDVNIHPNPFVTATDIDFKLSWTGDATVEVYNMLGVMVASLFNDVVNAKEKQTITFTPASNMGQGVFFCVVRTEKGTMIKRMILIK